MRHRTPTAPSGSGISGPSVRASTAVLLRVFGPDGDTIHQDEYAGYESSSDQNRYLPLRVLASEAESLAEDRRGWAEVPAGELRSSHFSDAFERNRSIMLGESHWWVLRYSLKALASLGNPEALPALAFIRSTYPDFAKTVERGCAGIPVTVREVCLGSRSRPENKESYDRTREEIFALIDRITASPERYLEGPPQTL